MKRRFYNVVYWSEWYRFEEKFWFAYENCLTNDMLIVEFWISNGISLGFKRSNALNYYSHCILLQYGRNIVHHYGVGVYLANTYLMKISMFKANDFLTCVMRGQ